MDRLTDIERLGQAVAVVVLFLSQGCAGESGGESMPGVSNVVIAERDNMTSEGSRGGSEGSDQTSSGSGVTVTELADSAQLSEYKFPNFVRVLVHEDQAAKLSWSKGRPQSLLPAPPFGLLNFEYGLQAFTVSSEGCSNGEIRVNGVIHKGSAFCIDPHKGVVRVSGEGFAIEALLDQGASD